MRNILLILLLLPSLSFGAVCDLPTKVGKGDPSPCDGYVISVETEKTIRTDLVYYKSYSEALEKRSALQQELLDIQDKRISLYNEQLLKERSNDFWQQTLYFTAGALVTTIIAYGAANAVR